MNTLLYSRSEHGTLPVRVLLNPTCYEVILPSTGITATFKSARSLITSFIGRPNHGLTFDRYFRIGRTSSVILPEGGTTLDLFRPGPRGTSGLTVASTKVRRSRRQEALTVAPMAGFGIDLVNRSHEVRKLFFAGFGNRVARSGFDPEEVLQEIYKGLLARNNGRCPFDSKKSSFGHYVYMVAECVLNNYHRKETRRREVEQVGVVAPASLREDEDSGIIDAALLATEVPDASATHEETQAVAGLTTYLTRQRAAGVDIDPLAVRMVPLLMAGFGRKEVAVELGVAPTRVSQVMVSLRQHTTQWMGA